VEQLGLRHSSRASSPGSVLRDVKAKLHKYVTFIADILRFNNRFFQSVFPPERSKFYITWVTREVQLIVTSSIMGEFRYARMEGYDISDIESRGTSGSLKDFNGDSSSLDKSGPSH